MRRRWWDGTCGKDSPVVQRVVIAKDYDRSLARTPYDCPGCYEKKEHTKTYHQEKEHKS